ncbi:MAG: exodeoxyribonuclease VII large subunit [Bacteroidia bacterium]|nr:exodeoxyribonuclease VII large subunit [Bacteroidia bacterium]
MTEPTIFPLSRITARIGEILAPVAEKDFWVQAEIGDVSDKGGHYYGTLVETKDGRQVAKLAFRMWNRDRTRIAAAFLKAGLVLELKTGMKVIFECRLEFHELYGLSLVASNADPRFILGELELRKREIIDRLTGEGADQLNKKWRVPQLPLRIGLITSRESAAYADVYKTLERGGFAYRVSFTEAVMQGENAEASILRALGLLDRLSVDLVILVRGGGSKSDLATLDNERIARAIATFNKPVWVAIGHETDSGVLDVVAHSSFKTPTALAEAIVSRFEGAARDMRQAEERIRREWIHAIGRQHTRIQRDTVGILQGSRKLAALTRTQLLGAVERMRRGVGERTISAHRNNDKQNNELRRRISSAIEHKMATLRTDMRGLNSAVLKTLRAAALAKEAQSMRLSPRRVWTIVQSGDADARVRMYALLGSAKRTVERYGEQLRASLDRAVSSNTLPRLRHEAASLEQRHTNVLAYDPRRVLARGFSIVRTTNGRIIGSIDAIEPGMSVGISFHDGDARASISSKEKHHE